MTYRTTCALGACLTMLAALPVGAQAGATAAIVLELPASPRAMALGNAYAAMGGDEASLFYNPAGLATLERAAGGLSVQRHLASSTLAALAVAGSVGPGTVALGLQVLDYGSEPELVPDPVYGGERGLATGADVSAQDLVLSLGYGATIGRVRAGAAAKFVRQRVADRSGGVAAFDVGVAGDLPRGITLGVALQHLGPELEIAGVAAPLPRQLRVAAMMPLPSAGPIALAATAQLTRPRESGTLPAGGIEAAWRSSNGLRFAARAGAADRPDESAASALTFGAGLAARHLALDYAWQGYETVGGAVHRLGVRWER